MKKKNDKPKGIRGAITKRIEILLASLDMLPLHLANKTGIANETIYRCLNGKRKWNLGHLEKIAPVLGVTLGDLVQETILVPRAGAIREGQGPPQEQILRPAPDQGSRPYRLKEDKETLSKMYSLEVEDRSMNPMFPPGTIFTAQRDTAEIIKNENYVVHWGEDGQTYIRQIFLDQDHIVLRSLTQGVCDKILPAKHIALCDKVLRIEFPS
jgi:DNA-binding Xre family transcriptional regulator